MNVIVIHEHDSQDGEQIVIGVASSIERAEGLIKDYYGEFKEVEFRDIRDSNLEYSKTLEVLDHLNSPYKVTVWLEWFEINESL